MSNKMVFKMEQFNFRVCSFSDAMMMLCLNLRCDIKYCNLYCHRINATKVTSVLIRNCLLMTARHHIFVNRKYLTIGQRKIFELSARVSLIGF